MKNIILLSFISLLICSCAGKQKKQNQLIVFAASSMTNVVQEISEDFEKETGIRVKLNIASSGILARQIESGAEFDYYVSANKNWMDYVDSLNLVQKNSIRNLASGQLVAIVPNSDNRKFDKDTFKNNFPNLFKGRLSIGDPKHVPAGKYAVQALKFYGCYKDFANRLLPAKNVRDALLMVEMGEVEVGIVYKTDAMKSPNVKIVHTFPQNACGPINYTGASKVGNSKSLDQFLLYLQSAQAKEIWTRNGFNIQ